MPSRFRLAIVLAFFAVQPSFADDSIGRRPYEMDWASRSEDTRPPLIDFEDLTGWTIQCQNAKADFSRTRKQQLWGKHVGELVYQGQGNRPQVTVRPPKPIPLPDSFDCINFWVYGNNWGWNPDPTTPQTEIQVLLAGDDGREIPVSLGRVRWKEWWLMHRRLTPDQLAQLGDSAQLTGLVILRGSNKQDRSLFFDNLCIYKEPLAALKFEARRKRGITLPAGQTVGMNHGPGQLPFPNREETILPDNVSTDFKVGLESSATKNEFIFRYRGADGELIYTYRPKSGTLSDITAEWVDRGGQFRPLHQGGIRFPSGDDSAPLPPETARLIQCEKRGDTVRATWDCQAGSLRTEVTFVLRLWQKSLVIDIQSKTADVAEFHIGGVLGVDNPRLVTLPFLAGAAQRPAILVSGPVSKPLFVSSFMDHCRSNASELWFANRISPKDTSPRIAVQNGGARYSPKTDGTRNRCFERLFLTVSPRFEETLPNIPNPPSPWKDVTGTRVWRAHGASDRQADYQRWKQVARYGMSEIVITDHETGWRDGGESFTMRTRAAPGKGGDAGQVEYSRKIRALGFRYGIYNNYTDYAPVNKHWDEDYVTRLSNGEWQTAWPRCYNPKPARAVELESRLAPIIQDKFHLDTAYCDVHTAVRPWSYCDFDARVPGAGTFAATFYAYGEIMLHQKETWNGPVYSEGNNHWYYCGLTDGNYGQDQIGQIATNPWLVDFDLRKMHPLCCNFGMGNPGMFFGRNRRLGNTADEREENLDRFLAATLAFGHTGFLVFDGGMQNTVRSYFSVQQVHSRYARQRAVDIQYGNKDGKLVGTSTAVASGAFRRSQVATRYEDGFQVFVNGHTSEPWTVNDTVLPPNGWLVVDESAKELTAFSALVDGHRADYVDSPAYLYANGRGALTRFEKAACDGQMIAQRRANGAVELIPVEDCSVFGIALDGSTASAVALDEAGQEISQTQVRFSRGLVYVSPIPNAFSYLLTPKRKSGKSLTCHRVTAIPGEQLTIEGEQDATIRIPRSAEVGCQYWRQVGSEWIDFSIRPLATTSLESSHPLRLKITPHLAQPTEAQITLGEFETRLTLNPEETATAEFENEMPNCEEVTEMSLQIAAGDLAHRESWWIKTEDIIRTIATLNRDEETGQCYRGMKETAAESASGTQVLRTSRSCNGETRDCLFMHPPYRNGVGYSYALSEPINLPKSSATVIRCLIGKADGSDPGDGILFRVAIVDAQGKATVAAEKVWKEHKWTQLEVDLSRWIGQRVQVKLITDVGRDNNSSGDWACWANIRVQDRAPTLVSTIHRQPVALTRVPGPIPAKQLTLNDVQTARRAVLHFEGIGLQSGGNYISRGVLNGVPIGQLPDASGDEAEGEWQEAELVLPTDAIKELSEWNVLQIENPTRDSFKVCRFWLDLELENGQRTSSHITTTVFTQPSDWAHAEGTGVPFGESISTKIRIPLK